MSSSEQRERKPTPWTDPNTVDPRLKERFRRRVLNAESSTAPPPWTRKLHAFSIVLTAAAGFYSVFYADFGSQEHVFSPLRRWYFAKVDSFTSLSKEDLEELRQRKKLP
ncbi:hypothetical protein BCR44DRAFT_121289 [Catenaria anguillulae PL171]|uniref:Uncharacterized protein n=1 Tax=Catenaria anguillulae PL171 TaxID=765915 RepID=A0A1Y2HZ90_9FUNG|nr:hypothetical protein BCR44DRAFT_121289 [Catenaria anguillulae PL171]